MVNDGLDSLGVSRLSLAAAGAGCRVPREASRSSVAGGSAGGGGDEGAGGRGAAGPLVRAADGGSADSREARDRLDGGSARLAEDAPGAEV